MTVTNNTGATMVEQSQAQKEITVNEGFARLDALLNRGAVDKDYTYPPASPAAGDIWIVGAGAQSDWAGHDAEIAYFDQEWRFIVPQNGSMLWVNNRDELHVYNSGVWNFVLSI